MVLVPSDSLYAVPVVGLVAHEAFAHLRVLLTSELHRNRLEMFHVVVWRGLVALDTTC